MGVHGFRIFLQDANEVKKTQSVGQSIFISSALRNMVDKPVYRTGDGRCDKLDPVALWSALEAYYDTAINRTKRDFVRRPASS